jgi:hypothetical protein
MTYSGDRSGPETHHPGIPGSAEVSPDDLERLATEFRPSWELDEAPFTGPAHFSAADIQSLQGGEGRHQVRQSLAAISEAFAPGGSARDVGSNRTPAGARANLALPVWPQAPTRAQAPSLDFESTLQARKFRAKPPWVILGGVAIVLVALGVWAASSGEPQPAAPVPPPRPTATAEPIAPVSAQPGSPPPTVTEPVTATAQVPAPVEPPPSTTSEPPVKAGTEVHTMAAPVAPSPPAPARAAPVTAAPARPLPNAKPPARPKGASPTIVRDVPF